MNDAQVFNAWHSFLAEKHLDHLLTGGVGDPTTEVTITLAFTRKRLEDVSITTAQLHSAVKAHRHRMRGEIHTALLAQLAAL